MGSPRAEHYFDVLIELRDFSCQLCADAAAEGDDGMIINNALMPPALQLIEDFILRLGAHRTGNEHDDVSPFGLRQLQQAGGREQIADALGIIDIHLASPDGGVEGAAGRHRRQFYIKCCGHKYREFVGS